MKTREQSVAALMKTLEMGGVVYCWTDDSSLSLRWRR